MTASAFPFTPALFQGHVEHARRSPAHGFRSGIYFHLFDVDDIPALDSRLHLFGYNRVRPTALWDRDHLGRPDRSIAENLRAYLAQQAYDGPADRVFLLTQCRVFGYVFNPISVYYCLSADGQLGAVVAEVHNTYGELHPYLLRSSAAAADFNGREKKVFHVSPFMTLDGTYHFRFSPPGAHIEAHLELIVSGSHRFGAHLYLRRLPLSDRAVLALLMRYPLMPQRVMTSIYWQALKLWRKQAVFHPKPSYDPAAAVESTVA